MSCLEMGEQRQLIPDVENSFVSALLVGVLTMKLLQRSNSQNANETNSGLCAVHQLFTLANEDQG